jgi:hypothetical protein
MALPWPLITFDPGTGLQTLTFLRPARRMTPFSIPPGIGIPKDIASIRHRNVASSGLIEDVFERFDIFLEFEMEFVSLGDDLDNWNRFVRWALPGGIFSFYPSAQNPTEGWTFWLEDLDWKPSWKQLGEYDFKIRMRKARPLEPSFTTALYG